MPKMKNKNDKIDIENVFEKFSYLNFDIFFY